MNTDSPPKIGIINYGMSNIASIVNMLKRCGAESEVISSPEALQCYKKIILPGVGAFDSGVRNLHELGFFPVLQAYVRQPEVTLLGICLGMQLLFERSAEGKEAGLGVIEGDVRRFDFPAPAALRVPHMGWNTVEVTRPNRLLGGGEEELRYYFVHSYFCVPRDPAVTIGTTAYGQKFCSVVEQGNIFGAQFHPEKSHRFGLALFGRFVELS